MENRDVHTEHRTFVDAEGVTIHTTVWHAESPSAIIQISHGLGDHSARYDHLARTLATQGFTVYADDHRGHGETGREQWGGDLSKLGRLGPGGLRATITAIGQFTGMIRAENPGLPLIFLGHSWGSLMGQIALDAGTLDVDAAVFSGSALRLPWSMNPGDLNAKHRHLGSTGSEWLSRDPDVAAAFLADPLTFKADVLKLFGLADGLRLYGTPKPPHADIPLLLISGTDDSVCSEKSLVELLRRYIAAGYSNAQLTMYDGARHEVYNETNRDEVYADVVRWIDTHVVKEAR
ncbi:MAG: alpha/beta fold hydrolase [Microbacteriaceae bacterium]